MATFHLTIRCNNAAFCDDDAGPGDQDGARNAEIARILRDLAMHVDNGATGGAIYDANGNRVGEYDLATG